MATYNAKTLTITNNGDNYIIDPLQGNDVAYRDITVDIDAEDWELSNDVYSYVWTSSYLTQNSQVQVYFKANVRGGLTGDLRVQKTTGQITFSTGEEPTDDISLLVRIIDANTTGILPINADMVETDAIVGETDVQGALEDLDERVRESSHDARGYYIGSFDSMTALKTALIALAAAHCPSAVGSTDPQTVVNFSFYPNFTDTTAGFYPVSNGERIGTMFIRAADISSCVITFRDGSITKMAYDGTWKVDKLASESVLGDPSSASAVTGSDAFSKINTLNNNITTLSNKLHHIQLQGNTTGGSNFLTNIIYSDGMIVSAQSHAGNLILLPYRDAGDGTLSFHVLGNDMSAKPNTSVTIEINYYY